MVVAVSRTDVGVAVVGVSMEAPHALKNSMTNVIRLIISRGDLLCFIGLLPFRDCFLSTFDM